MTSFMAPPPILIIEAVGGGRRALLSMPNGVEDGVIFWGSETVRSDGRRLGTSEGDSEGPSSGVLASEESAEPGDVGLPSPSLSPT